MTEHEYEPDPKSGAGNCTCGAVWDHRRHPHKFRRASLLKDGHRSLASHCVCGLPPIAPIHNREAAR